MDDNKTKQNKINLNKKKNQNSSLISPTRPICLWDPLHSMEKQPKVDSFGRCVAYSLTEPVGHFEEHRCVPTTSKTQPKQESQAQEQVITATHVWQDFVQEFWPSSSLTTSPSSVTATA